MLEKIGLPAKPSLRGSNWVVDASHCQGCSSQFTFINRKHHCRRCGGIFCNGCTHQRMYLRGQGDSPVRICDPCKKLEEAARFEMRHGNKIRAGRGSSKTTSKHEDEVLNQILGADGKQTFSSARESNSKVVGDFEGDTSNASTSNFDEESVTHDGNGSVHTQNDTVEEIGSPSPEELRQRALEEKQKYKILKGEGKPDEALRAFKRGKELEREAKALEIALKKSQRKAVSSSSVASIHKANDDHEESGRKRKVSSQMDKERKDDLAAELRELGWSETDLLDADKKPANISLEGELSSLIGEVHKKSGIGPRTGGVNKAEVIALKKRALKFKREGNLAEAKEELKRAKVLEQKLEEQELLGEAEDSDDDLLALINSIDDDKQDDFSFSFEQDTGFNLDHLVGVSDDLGLDGGFDVTDADMYDPEIAAALTSLGWTEDSEHAEDSTGATALQPVSKDGKALLDEALSLKKEAVRQKKSGNVEAAMSLLRKAKLLEKDAENLHSQGNSSIVCNPSENMPASQMAEISSSVKVDDDMKHVNAKLPPKSKLAIQRELLGIKKKALALRREGRTDEAEEELRKGKVLEAQLEEMESTPKVRSTTVKVGSKVSEPVDLKEEVEDVDVTDQDMQDPALLSVLQNLGWKDEDEASKSFPSSDCATDSSALQSTFGIPVAAPRRTKAQIQRELLGLKRKALTLRRQGEDEEAEEILRQAKVLEEQMAEIEAPKRELMNSAKVEPEDTGSLGVQEAQRNMQETQNTESPLRSLVEKDATVGNMKAMDEVRTGESEIQMRSKDESPALSMDFGWIGSNSFITPPKITSIYDSKASQPVTLDFVAEEGVSDQVAEEGVSDQASSFKHSSQSINLMDMVTGEDLQRSKLPIKIETNGNVSTNIQNGPFIQPATSKSSIKEIGSIGSISREQREKALGPTEKLPTHEASGPDSDSQNHSNIQQEILIRKRKAVALKREGKLAEAREELRQAKLLEKSQQQETVQPEASSIGVSHPTSNETPNVQEQRVTHQAPKPMSGRDRFKLQQESLSHKRQALKLRREGRTEEAEAEFELAKALETQLEELSGQDSSNRSKSKNDDLVVEDLLDPQLLSALRSIGLDDTVTVPSVSDRSEVSKASFDKTPSISPEKSQPKVNPSETASQEKNELEERIKAEKVKAVTLKRAGKQTEALDALRRAKLYEKKLNSLA